MDSFFVLSGYLITTILLRLKGSSQPFLHFHKRRGLRILPPLTLALVAIFAACRMDGDLKPFSRRSLVTYALFAQSFGSPRFLPHPHLWSLIASSLAPGFDGLRRSMSNRASILWSLSIDEYLLPALGSDRFVINPEINSASRVRDLSRRNCISMLYFRGRQDYFSIYHRFDALIYGALAALLFQQLIGKRWILRIAAALSAGLMFLILWRSAPVIGREIRDDPLFMILGWPLIATFVASDRVPDCDGCEVPTPAWLVLRAWPMRMLGVLRYCREARSSQPTHSWLATKTSGP